MTKFLYTIVGLLLLYLSGKITYKHFVKNSTKVEAYVYATIAMSIFGFIFTLALNLLKHYGFYPE